VKKPKIQDGALRVRVWPVLQNAIETGIDYGWQRAHKHTDKPDIEIIKEQISMAITHEISEAFRIEDGTEQ
jgi:hypothetical protein